MKKTSSIPVLLLGYAFLYIPLLVIVIYSFNSSRVFSVWQGFSLNWYKMLLNNEALFAAVCASLRIATVAATCATILGTMTAVISVRIAKNRKILEGMIASPLIMPDVMMGLALLLVFISIQQSLGTPIQRGAWSVTAAHITLGMAYVYLVVRARLQDFDMSLEEAALDLGARPLTVFCKITIPIIFPALFSGWLLAFALSLDDVVLASFLSGPGATTLPMLIFSNIRLGISPEINALATIILGVVILAVLGSAVMGFRKSGDTDMH